MKIRLLFALGVALAAAGLLAGAASADMTYLPAKDIRLCNALPAGFADVQLAGNAGCADNLGTAAPADHTHSLSLAAGNVLFERLTTFVPAGFSVNAGAGIPAGTKLGGVRWEPTVSFANGVCTTAQTIDVVLYNIALPDNPGDPRASTNLGYPRDQGQSDRFGRFETGAPSNNAVDNIDVNSDGRADAASVAIQNYPKYLLDAFDADFVAGVSDGAALPVLPIAAYGGLTEVFGEWQPLYWLQFGAGALAGQPGLIGQAGAAMGQPAVPVFGDPTATVASVSAITDVCTPLALTTTLLGQDPSATHIRATNPVATGTSFFIAHSISKRDLDQDGVENDLDSCPANVNTGDTDVDGIDDSCDPGGAFTADFDGDTFLNRQDNCPTAGNVTQTQAEAIADIGQAFIPMPSVEKHFDFGAPDGMFAVPFESAYRDANFDNLVNVGELRLTAYSGFAAGSVVAVGNSDVNATLVTFAPSEGFAASAGPQYDPGEAMYRDNDSSGTISIGDTRIIGPAGLPAGTVAKASSPDSGPLSDGMGDPCDTGAVTFTQNKLSLTVTRANNVPNGRYLLDATVIPVCIGGTDADGDGYCAADRDAGLDSGACAPSCDVRHQAWKAPNHPLSAAGMLDADGDGWLDHKETYLSNNSLCVQTGANMPHQSGNAAPPCTGTNYLPRVDATKSCAHLSTSNNEHPYDNWPLDYNDTQGANTSDILSITSRLNQPVNASGSGPGNYGDERWDLNQDGFVNVTDVVSHWSLSAVPVALSRACATIVPAIPPFSQQ